MSSDQPHRIINTRERGTSTDVNRITDLSDRNLQQAMFYMAAQDTVESGVFTGLTVSVAAGLGTVTAGFGLLFDSAKAYPDSQYRWVELVTAVTNISLDTATANRWIVIEIEAGSATTITTSVDVFDPTTDSFVATSLAKEVQSNPTITATVGSTPEEFPAPTAGRLPLAYVYVDSGNSVGTGTANVVQCRPLLWSKAPLDSAEFHVSGQRPNRAWITGGGASVTADGQVTTLEACTGRFFGHRHAFFVQQGSAFDLTATQAWDGNTKASTDTNVYLYALPPPYASGYGTIAAREFVVGSAVTGNFEGFTTTSEINQLNCLLIASETAPDSSLIGYHGAGSGNGTVYGPFETTGATSSRVDWVYLGTVDWDTTLAKQQKFVVGESRIVPESRWPLNQIALATGSPGAAISFDPRIGASATGTSPVADGDGLFPPHVQDIRLNVRMTGAVNGLYEFLIDDDETTSSLAAGLSKQLALNVVSGVGNVRQPIDIVSTGTTITATEDAASTGNFDIISLSYIDSIIASR